MFSVRVKFYNDSIDLTVFDMDGLAFGFKLCFALISDIIKSYGGLDAKNESPVDLSYRVS